MLTYSAKWIVDGYSTMLQEVDKQVLDTVAKPASLVVFPVGVGSLAQAVIAHYKNPTRSTPLLAVEADTAACLLQSLENGMITSIPTENSIMCGLNCGTVSSTAWPMLRDGIDVATTVTDLESHQAVLRLQSLGISVGPCGAAPLAALESMGPRPLNLDSSSVVVLLCTEGSRDYEHPVDF